jgi:hypothetical protein
VQPKSPNFLRFGPVLFTGEGLFSLVKRGFHWYLLALTRDHLAGEGKFSLVKSIVHQ